MSDTPKITIATLIYRSTAFAEHVAMSLFRHTTQLHNGDAEMLFVANDPEPHVVNWLLEKVVDNPSRFVVQNNPCRSQKWLADHGYGKPEYINRVYRGWNRAIMEAWGDKVVLVNSDHCFSPGWLDALLEAQKQHPIICSQVVERPGHEFPGSWLSDFGDHPSTFRESEFLACVDRLRKPGAVREGGEFMPVLFNRADAIAAGLYPEGNLAETGDFEKVTTYGDADFFRRMRARLGCGHFSSLDSIVYHFHEGEMRE